MDDLKQFHYEQRDCQMHRRKNIIPNILNNSWWTNGLTDWHLDKGQVSINEDEYGFSNLCVDNSSHIEQELRLRPNHIYFLMFDVKVIQYVCGLFGVTFHGKFKNCSSDLGLRRKSKNGDFETVIGNLETTEEWSQPRSLFVGCMDSASGAGQIRKMSLYDLTDIYGVGNEPSAADFYKVLPTLLDEEGICLNTREIFLVGTPRKKRMDNTLIHPIKKDVVQLFLDEMNKKAEMLDMTCTNFKNVIGFRAPEQTTTVNDYLKLGLYATGFNELLKVWGKRKHEVLIFGPHSRKLTIETSVRNLDLEDHYMVLGGKTGTRSSEILDVITLISNSYNEVYLAMVMGLDGKHNKQNCFSAVKELVDLARLVERNHSISSLTLTNVEAGGIIKIPQGNPFFYTNQPIKMIYGMSEKKKIDPSSIVKVMNAVILLENFKDLSQNVTLIESDIVGGTGPKLIVGDVISLLDILHLSMLSSSNIAAKVIARVVGQKLMGLH
ncbi:serine hydrolase [Enterococcus hulanensis]|uniref:serine hydrolase n=1 Tax=Enterococcus hulanensis TaxID=2559929 RepID=UPI0028926A2A|nr:serine hydrolase [Enterococcus hulanensis]MDT2661977.1 serine hydrolase [Enterococcus hulanensis]